MTDSTTHPFQLTAPFTMTVQPDASGTFQVTNTGTKALTIHESLGRFSAKAIKYPAADHATTTTMNTPWLTVSPSVFTLAPGQAETVHIASHVPANASGEHFLDVVWSAQPAQTNGGELHLAGAIATTVGIPLAGVAQPVTSATSLPRAVPAPGHGGFSTMDTGGAVCAALVVAAAGTVAVRRLRRRGRHAGAGRAA